MVEANALHQAIEDALAAPGYPERGILVNRLLAATSPLYVNEKLLYRAVYTIFRALPDRLVPGTTLDVATSDLPEGGIEIYWEGKERLVGTATDAKDLRHVLGHGPHGDLVEIALLALENYCSMHAGYMDTYREVARSSSFERPPYVMRRVLAALPGPERPSEAPAAQRASPSLVRRSAETYWAHPAPGNQRESPGGSRARSATRTLLLVPR